MINQMLIGGYVVIALVVIRSAAQTFIAHEAARVLARRERNARDRWRDIDIPPDGMTIEEYRTLRIAEQGPLVDGDDRIWMTGFACMAGALWPVYLTFRLLLRMVGSTPAPAELTVQERLELIELREKAREHGLPMPASEER